MTNNKKRKGQAIEQIELKICPFCGEKPETAPHIHEIEREFSFSIRCSNFGCPVLPETDWMHSHKEAASAWNKRKKL